MYPVVSVANGCDFQGVPPATLAEFTLGVDGKPDYYDVSLVDGSNLPMKLTSTKGCPTASCPVDLNPNCKPNISIKYPAAAPRFRCMYL